ncbi:hypothetical protein BXY82_1850 [Gelidibacter sediminis]|uniref:Uncharacterized protein n=1 Tax=Gelidibacter sediminis TaxID=1608710 RepID=A0A4R7PXZ8_9FLAO|nr:BfmA/BtgA family mobilization protein [Gelidibacter sediminis]TDU39818.1 hypothetical protein BXY82_1850 [Gelidibacter sediminis]
MDRGYEKERFVTIKIKSSVARKFKQFSKRMSKSQSMTLLLMLDFFEVNGISPSEAIGPQMVTLEAKLAMLIKKRMNGMIAILKDIEKTQTKPAAAMLYALFEQAEQPQKKLILEKKFVKETKQVRFREKNSDSTNT